MMSLAKIKEYCAEAFKKGGYDFAVSGIAVVINGRLTRTLGRCYSECINGVYTPTRIEISRQLIETSSDKSIVDVIFHECCHALVVLETGEMHRHDKIFKAMCARIGAEADGAVLKEVEHTVAEDSLYKYVIYCPNCGMIGGKNRMCRTLREIEFCTCKKCGGSGLSYIQNW